MKTAASLVLLASFTAGLSATASGQTFNRVIGLNGNESANAVAPTRDGGYVTAGAIVTPGSNDAGDILVVKYNPDGSLQWASRFGGPGLDVGYSIKQTMDGGYVIGAETSSVSPLLNLAMLKLDAGGNYQWAWVHEGDQSSEDIVHGPGAGVGVAEFMTTAQVPGYALVGRKRVSETYQTGVLVRTAINGAPIANYRYTDSRFTDRSLMTFSDVKTDIDGTMVVSGTEMIQTPSGVHREPLIMRTQNSGVPMFAINYPTSLPGANVRNSGSGDGLAITNNRDIVFNGRNDLNNGSQNMHTFRIDPAGNVLWMTLFNRSGSAYRSIHQDDRSDIAMGGWVGNFPAASSGLLAVLNPAGNPVFGRKYDLINKADGTVPCFASFGYALTGTINVPAPVGYGGSDIELIHTDDAGFVGCLEAPLNPDPSRVPVFPARWEPLTQPQFSTIWQGEFRRWTLRDEPLCITPACPVCPADFNEDGGVDGSDINAFFQAWQDGESCADVNQDGGVDGADIAPFFILWQNGGC